MDRGSSADSSLDYSSIENVEEEFTADVLPAALRPDSLRLAVHIGNPADS
jgi:hypothetical protein